MGDPKKFRKTYARPRMVWNEDLLKSDKELIAEFRVRNKKEIWKANSFLKNIKGQAKDITALMSTAKKDQALKQKELLIQKVKRLGIIKKEEISLADMLTLSVRDVMNRRLQTLVAKKDLARTVGQARQFIVHGHIKVGDRKMTSPSYIVPVAEENLIDYTDKSALNSPSHPEKPGVDPNIVIKQKEEAKAAADAAKKAKAEKKSAEKKSTEAENPETAEATATEGEAKTE